MPLPVDSVCKCRHRSDHHVPRLVKACGTWLLVPGTGTCRHRGCPCEKFAVAGWVRRRSNAGALVREACNPAGWKTWGYAAPCS